MEQRKREREKNQVAKRCVIHHSSRTHRKVKGILRGDTNPRSSIPIAAEPIYYLRRLNGLLWAQIVSRFIAIGWCRDACGR
jgi:hypothetical protein